MGTIRRAQWQLKNEQNLKEKEQLVFVRSVAYTMSDLIGSDRNVNIFSRQNFKIIGRGKPQPYSGYVTNVRFMNMFIFTVK